MNVRQRQIYTGYSVLLMEVAPVYLENPSLVIIVLILTYPYLHPQTLTGHGSTSHHYCSQNTHLSKFLLILIISTSRVTMLEINLPALRSVIGFRSIMSVWYQARGGRMTRFDVSYRFIYLKLIFLLEPMLYEISI